MREGRTMTALYSPLVVLVIALYFIAGTIALIFAFLGWRHRNIPISLPFTLLMASLTIWFYAYILEITSPDLETSLFYNNIEVVCILTVPVAFLLIALYSTGRERYVTARTLPLLFFGTVIFSILEFTNPFHFLYYPGFVPVALDGLVLWIHLHGPFFWMAIAYLYALSLAALILIISHRSETGTCHRRSLNLLAIAAAVPLAFNMVSTFRLTPIPGIDLTPVSFLVTGLLLAFGLFRYLFSTVPVAYTTVLATMQDGVIITDASSRVIDLNPAAVRITGVRLRHAVGREIGEILPALLPCLGGDCLPEEGSRAECQVTGTGAEPRYYDVAAIPLGGRDSGTEGRLVVLRDITERKQAELALSEANRKISLLSGITRHDIRNQLMALKAYLQLGGESLENPAELAGYLQRLQRIADTIERQIAFTQNYESMGTNPPSWQDVEACIRNAVADLPMRGIRADIETPGLFVFADPMLEKVFYNLIDNALRYGGDRMTTIRIASRVEGASQVLTVEDDGEGVAREDKPRMFTRGFGKNSGLGLFLSREILSITGITINENGDPGRGARFEIRVPAGKFRFTGAPADNASN